jgi:hypothetical protein
MSEEFFDHPHELARALPNERMVGTVDNDKLRTVDAVVEQIRVI